MLGGWHPHPRMSMWVTLCFICCDDDGTAIARWSEQLTCSMRACHIPCLVLCAVRVLRAGRSLPPHPPACTFWFPWAARYVASCLAWHVCAICATGSQNWPTHRRPRPRHGPCAVCVRHSHLAPRTSHRTPERETSCVLGQVGDSLQTRYVADNPPVSDFLHLPLRVRHDIFSILGMLFDPRSIDFPFDSRKEANKRCRRTLPTRKIRPFD